MKDDLHDVELSACGHTLRRLGLLSILAIQIRTAIKPARIPRTAPTRMAMITQKIGEV